MSNLTIKDTELRDKITALVFEWHKEVQKYPRGKTISFWKDDEIMQLIESAITEAHTTERLETLDIVSRVFTGSEDFYVQPAKDLKLTVGQIKGFRDTIEELKQNTLDQAQLKDNTKDTL